MLIEHKAHLMVHLYYNINIKNLCIDAEYKYDNRRNNFQDLFLPSQKEKFDENALKFFDTTVHIYVKKKRTSSEVKVIVGPFKVKKNNYIVALLSQNIFIKV